MFFKKITINETEKNSANSCSKNVQLSSLLKKKTALDNEPLFFNLNDMANFNQSTFQVNFKRSLNH